MKYPYQSLNKPGIIVMLLLIFQMTYAGHPDALSKRYWPAFDMSVADGDGDGYDSDVDCDDANPAIHPGAAEVCNGADDNCNGEADEDLPLYTYYQDQDMDGYGNAGYGEQQLCNPIAPTGWSATNDDCHPWDGTKHPGAAEVCNQIDDDCDGLYDEDFPIYTYYQDQDLDGYGNAGYGEQQLCNPVAPIGWSATNDDCHPWDETKHPGAAEVCNQIDDDCDGTIDDGFTIYTYYQDQDLDGYGNAGYGEQQLCNTEAPAGWSATNDDCHPWDGTKHPGAAEVCNQIDDDCDGLYDEDFPIYTYYQDQDLDGYGNAGYGEQQLCNPLAPIGWSATNDDCHPWDDTKHPGAAEVCNQIDDDCDGIIDDGFTIYTYYQDQDLDGYGNAGYGEQQLCNTIAPAGWSATNDDCHPWDGTKYPGATEFCNGIDDDCNGEIDDNCIEENDIDEDGIPDALDNCVTTSNPDQEDSDCDAVGDICDVCPGGDDGIDNNYDGLPDCHFLPAYTDILPEWKCGNNKVLVAHIDEEGICHTHCFNYNAAQVHINHGDYLGPCGSSGCEGGSYSISDSSFPTDESVLDHAIPFLEPDEMNANQDFHFHVYPNPSSEDFEILLETEELQKVTVRVYSLLGKTMEVIVSPRQNVIRFGAEYASGLYLVMVHKGNTYQTIAVAKENK